MVKNPSKERKFKVEVIISLSLALLSVIALVIDEMVKPFLDNNHEVKLYIILCGVISAFQPFIWYGIQKEIDNAKNEIELKCKTIEGKLNILNSSIPFSALDSIEAKHGRLNPASICEIWIISNMLQEANNDEIFLKTIFDNILHNRVNYYYILPNTEKCNNEILSLQSRLKELKGKRERKFTGAIFFRFDNELNSLISASYFDTVLYVDVDENRNPKTIGNKYSCEGFQCFSNESEDNLYFYQSIEEEKIQNIRRFQLDYKYTKLDI